MSDNPISAMRQQSGLTKTWMISSGTLSRQASHNDPEEAAIIAIHEHMKLPAPRPKLTLGYIIVARQCGCIYDDELIEGRSPEFLMGSDRVASRALPDCDVPSLISPGHWRNGVLVEPEASATKGLPS